MPTGVRGRTLVTMQTRHRSVHRRLWQALALLLAIALGGALALRLTVPPPAAPVLLAPPR